MAYDFSKQAVLIVDDFQNMRTTLKKMLQSIGADDIDMASNGKEAVDRMARRPYDIVLCDYNLGEGKDGQQVLEEAKHRRLIGPATIFVMITAENTMEMVMGAIEYRPDDYLTKPFNKDLLKSRLEKLVERKRDLRPIEEAIEKKELERAAQLCDARIARSPRNVNELLRLKCDLLMDVGQLAEAERVCMQVLAVRKLPWARFALGRIRFLGGKLDEAAEIFRELMNEHRTFMEAYDWLAKCLTRQGKTKEAQQILASAAQLSPRAILRQQALGELASQNADYAVAEQAYRRAVGLGRESVYKDANNYTGLAKALVHTSSGQEAVKALHRLRKDFNGDPGATLKAAMGEGDVYRSMNRESEARAAFEEASKVFGELEESLGPETKIEMAKQFLLFDEKERGLALMQDVVSNHHESDELLAVAQAAFKEAGLEEEGSQLIADARSEVVKLNNEGVALFKAGKLDESIQLFEEAATRLPSNHTVNLNAAQVLLKKVQSRGKDDASLARIRQYLSRAGQSNPSNPTYRKLLGMYESLI